MAPEREIMGHEGPCSVLARMVTTGRGSHAWLFHGPDGVGKRTCAMAFARALVCDRPEGLVQCGRCRSCASGQPDVLALTPTGREIPVARVDALQIEVHRRPVVARRRVFVIDGAERMGPEAANRLLKTIEEPPLGVVMILVTARPYEVLPTIRSRTQALRFGPLPTALIERDLLGRGVAPDVASRAAKSAQGSLARARSIAEGGYTFRDKVLAAALSPAMDRATGLMDIIKDAAKGRTLATEAEADEAEEAAVASAEAIRASAGEALDHLLLILRDAIAVAEGADVALCHADRADLAGRLAAAAGPRAVLRNAWRVEEALSRVRDPRNFAVDLVLDEALCEASFLCDTPHWG